MASAIERIAASKGVTISKSTGSGGTTYTATNTNTGKTMGSTTISNSGGGGSGNTGGSSSGSSTPSSSSYGSYGNSGNSGNSAPGSYSAVNSRGTSVTVSSPKAVEFIGNAAAGSYMTGGDGSRWVKNADGSTTVTATDGTVTQFNAPSSANSVGSGNSGVVPPGVAAAKAAVASGGAGRILNQGGQTNSLAGTTQPSSVTMQNTQQYSTTPLGYDPSLAGRVISYRGQNYYYDEKGSQTGTLNANHKGWVGTDRSVLAQSMDAVRRIQRGEADPNNLDTLVLSDKNLKDFEQIDRDVAAGIITKEYGEQEKDGIRSRYGYTGSGDGVQKVALTTFEPSDPSTQPGSQSFSANPNTNWNFFIQDVHGSNDPGAVSTLGSGGAYGVTPGAGGTPGANGVNGAPGGYGVGGANGAPGGYGVGGTNVTGSSTPGAPGNAGYAPDLTSLLDRWLLAAQEQAQQRTDYAVEQGVNDLRRAREDAQQQFQTERDQIAAAEAKARDNQALYNERRGDRGGIGAAQYDSIANTAAKNQLAVNQAQTKLATDTSRMIADLRAQGEFQKADQILQLSQTYLQNLINLQQWAAQYNLSVEQFNQQVAQWNRQFELQVAELTGSYGGMPTLAAQQMAFNQGLALQQNEFDQAYRTASLTGTFNGEPTVPYLSGIADFALKFAQQGIMPGPEQMSVLKHLYGDGVEEQIAGMVQTAQLAKQAKLSGGGGSGGGGGYLSAGTDNSHLYDSAFWAPIEAKIAQGMSIDDIMRVGDYYKALGFKTQADAKSAWANYNAIKNGVKADPKDAAYQRAEELYGDGKPGEAINILAGAYRVEDRVKEAMKQIFSAADYKAWEKSVANYVANDQMREQVGGMNPSRFSQEASTLIGYLTRGEWEKALDRLSLIESYLSDTQKQRLNDELRKYPVAGQALQIT